MVLLQNLSCCIVGVFRFHADKRGLVNVDASLTVFSLLINLRSDAHEDFERLVDLILTVLDAALLSS